MLKKLKNKVLLWLMDTHFYNYMLIHVIPYIRFTLYYTSFKGWKYHQGYKLLQPGDIILTQDSKKLTTFLIGGEYSHAALCVSKDGIFEVAEMTHTNYTKSCFFDICKEADKVAIIRCKDWDPEYTIKVIEKCRTFEDCLYDNEFEFGVKSLYCSELVYQSDFEKRLIVSLEDLAGIGRLYISPFGLYQAKNIEIIWLASLAKKPEALE
jgi:hypothetical protein